MTMKTISVTQSHANAVTTNGNRAIRKIPEICPRCKSARWNEPKEKEENVKPKAGRTVATVEEELAAEFKASSKESARNQKESARHVAAVGALVAELITLKKSQ